MFYLLMMSIGMLIMGSCQKDEVLDLPMDGKIKLTETSLPTGEQLSVFADKALQVGYQNLYFQVKKNGLAVKDQPLTFAPIMDMGSMAHGAPSGTLTYQSNLEAYQGFVVFTMPSGESGTWSLKVTYQGKEMEIPVVVTAAAIGNTPVKTISGNDGKKYVLALVEPSKPKMGMNDLLLMVFLRENMFSFSPVEGLILGFHPEMTSMNHGSPNNVIPVSIGKGKYEGKVNFTMTGDWRLFFDLKSGETEIAKDIYLDLLF